MDKLGIFLVSILVDTAFAICQAPVTISPLQYTIEYLSLDVAVVQVIWSSALTSSSTNGTSREREVHFAVKYKELNSEQYTTLVTSNHSFILPTPQDGQSYLVGVTPCEVCSGEESTSQNCALSSQSREIQVDVHYIQSLSVTPKSNTLEVLCTLARVKWTSALCLLKLTGGGVQNTYFLHPLWGSDPPVAFERITALSGGMYTYTSSAVDTSTYAAIGKVNISGSAVITSSDGNLNAVLIVLVVVAAIFVVIIIALLLEVIRHWRKASGVGCTECCSNYNEYRALCCACSPSSGELELKMDDDDSNNTVEEGGVSQTQPLPSTPTQSTHNTHISLPDHQRNSTYHSEV